MADLAAALAACNLLSWLVGMLAASLEVGTAGLFYAYLVGVLVAPSLAVTFGLLAVRRCRRDPSYGGKTLATVAIVIGGTMLAIYITFLVAYALAPPSD